MHAEFAVVAKEQLSKESSEPVQVTPCRYTGFRSSIKPPLAAMAPEYVYRANIIVHNALSDNVLEMVLVSYN